MVLCTTWPTSHISWRCSETSGSIVGLFHPSHNCLRFNDRVDVFDSVEPAFHVEQSSHSVASPLPLLSVQPPASNDESKSLRNMDQLIERLPCQSVAFFERWFVVHSRTHAGVPIDARISFWPDFVHSATRIHHSVVSPRLLPLFLLSRIGHRPSSMHTVLCSTGALDWTLSCAVLSLCLTGP